MTESTSLTNQYSYASSCASALLHRTDGTYAARYQCHFLFCFFCENLPSTSARRCRPCFRTRSTQSYYYASSTPSNAFSFPLPSSHASPPQKAKLVTTRGCPASIHPRFSSQHIPRALSQSSTGTTVGGPCSPSPGWFLMSLGEKVFMAQVSTLFTPFRSPREMGVGRANVFVCQDGMYWRIAGRDASRSVAKQSFDPGAPLFHPLCSL